MASTKRNGRSKPSYNGRKPLKQLAWEYMRRNRIFRVGDLMILLNKKETSFKPYLSALEKAGYIRVQTEATQYSERHYIFLKNTGIYAPAFYDNKIYDYNTEEEQELPKPKASSPPREKHTPTTLLLLLQAMEEKEMSKENICQKADVPISTAKKWWTRLLEWGVMREITPIRRDQNRKKLFKIDISCCRICAEICKEDYHLRQNPDIPDMKEKIMQRRQEEDVLGGD